MFYAVKGYLIYHDGNMNYTIVKYMFIEQYNNGPIQSLTRNKGGK